MKDIRVKDLKNILDKLPDDLLIVIPVVDENDVNRIYGFRILRTAGVLTCEGETDPEALCLNGASEDKNIADQIYFSGIDVSVKEVFFEKRKGENNEVTS